MGGDAAYPSCSEHGAPGTYQAADYRNALDLEVGYHMRTAAALAKGGHPIDEQIAKARQRIAALAAGHEAQALRPRERYQVRDARGFSWYDSGSNSAGALASARDYCALVAAKGWGPYPRVLQLWSTDPVEPAVEWREVQP